MATTELKPVLLLILDGWGLSPQTENNAIELGPTPTWHKLWREQPHTRLVTNGPAVGLTRRARWATARSGT